MNIFSFVLCAFAVAPPIPDSLPKGAIAQFGSPRFRANYPFTALAGSPDGKWVATASATHGAQIWDRASGALVRTFPDAPSMWKLTFSPDSRVLFAANQAVDVATGKVLFSYAASDPYPQLAVTADGKWLATGAGNDVQRMSASTGEDAEPLTGHAARVVAVAASPTRADEIASGDQRGQVIGWDLAKSAIRWRLDLKRGLLMQGLAYHPEGRLLATADSAGDVKLWEEGKAVRTLGRVPLYIRGLSFDQRGRLAVASDEGSIYLFDSATGKSLGTWACGTRAMFQISFHPQGHDLVGIGFSATVLDRWNGRTGKRFPLPRGHGSAIAGLIAQSGGRVLSLGMDRQVIRWQGDAMQARVALPGIEGVNPSTLLLSGDGARVGSVENYLQLGKQDMRLGIYDTRNGERLRRIELGQGFRHYTEALAFHPDHRTMLALGRDWIQRWHEKDPEEKTIPFKHVNRRGLMVVAPDGKTFLIPGANRVFLFDAKTGKPTQEIPVTLPARLVNLSTPQQVATFSPDGEWLALCQDQPNRVVLWHLPRILPPLTFPLRNVPVGAFFSPEGRWLAILQQPADSQATREGGHVAVVERASGQTVFTASLPTESTRAAFAPDEPVLYTGGMDGLIYTWRFASREASRDLAADWERLGKPEGYDAAWRLAQTPEAIAFLARKVHPSESLDPKTWASLLDDLDADDFEKRIQAERTLQKLGRSIAGMVRQSIASDPRLEVRRRLERLARSWPSDPDSLREARVIGILEQQRARGLLYRLSEGHPEADLTREARAALNRLQYQDRTRKED
jgi:WD40 repeat protein